MKKRLSHQYGVICADGIRLKFTPAAIKVLEDQLETKNLFYQLTNFNLWVDLKNELNNRYHKKTDSYIMLNGTLRIDENYTMRRIK